MMQDRRHKDATEFGTDRSEAAHSCLMRDAVIWCPPPRSAAVDGASEIAVVAPLLPADLAEGAACGAGTWRGACAVGQGRTDDVGPWGKTAL